jgi:hypothetical protein
MIGDEDVLRKLAQRQLLKSFMETAGHVQTVQGVGSKLLGYIPKNGQPGPTIFFYAKENGKNTMVGLTTLRTESGKFRLVPVERSEPQRQQSSTDYPWDN